VKAIGQCKLLFIELNSLRRFGNLQEKAKQQLFRHRRRSKMQASRHKTLESRPVDETVEIGELQFRRLLYAKHLH
jgi:hypothetical protein